ncbi:phage tail tape measure protein [Paenibacillus sp. 19GGS1-52]|uniref:phage tail tape measure protein n=1 Tax=Paenibacillus sp. 19GGS1-52 TaxID=2758563 RepID=UPI001EFA7561|nr:phage tail tape measure protein [Paenibacillus sp. 19GGS1-52]ULO08936.1 phage tail tape measure protein [Paenibacillus sp. 19GGS1-52]
MAGGIIGSLMYAVGFKFNSGGIDEADSKVKALTKGVIGMGALAGSAMIGIGTAALTAASNFESAMSHVQLTTGQTTAQMEATKEVAKNLYNQNFGEDWADLGGSISAVAKATGLTGSALESASREAMLYANAFDGDVTESIAGVSVAMNNFGVTSTEAFNLLTQGQNRGLDTQGDMLDSVNEYSQAFASVGFTMEDTFGYLDNGMKAGARSTDLLGDAMNEFSIQSIEAGGTAVQSFQALGLNSDKMMATFSKGGPEAKKAFRDIVSMITDVQDPVQQNTIGVGLFGTQFEELGIKAFSALDDVNTGFDQSKDSAANLFNGFTSIGDSIQYFKRHVETGILIPIGQKLLPYLSMFGSWISSHQSQIAALGAVIGNGLGAAIEKVSGWVQAAVPYLQAFGDRAGKVFGDLVTKGKELWISLEPVVVLIGQTLLSAATSLWPVLQNISSALSTGASEIIKWSGFAPVLAGAAAAFGAYKTVVMLSTLKTKAFTLATKIQAAWTARATLATRAMSFAMAMNPIGLVVAALVGLGVALFIAYKKSDKFRAFVDGMWAGIKKATMAALNFFKITIPKYFMMAFNAVTSFLKKWGVTILAVIGGPITLIALLIYKNWDKIQAVTVSVFTAIWNWMKSIWKSIASTVSGAALAVWGAVRGAWNKVFSTTNSLMTKVWNKITGIWGQIVGGIKTAGVNVWAAVSEMWGKVTGFFTDINLFDVGERIMQSLIDGISSMTDSITKKVKAIGGGISDGVKSAFGIKDSPSFKIESGMGTGRKSILDGSNAKGLAYVPFDGYISELHKGERVLTAKENEDYSRYTPETAPARTTNNTSKADFNPVFNITVQGSADKQTLANLRETIRREMQDVFESYTRSAGLDGA